MNFTTLHDISVKGKRVLLRADLNVPLNENGEITDDSRIRAALPTINYVLGQGGSVVLMSHLGRPDGKRVAEFSLAPVAKRLSALLGKEITLAPDCIGDVVEKMASRLNPGEILLLENLRFYPGEESPEEHPDFIEKLSRIGDVYINDAFATAHRKHASTFYLPEHYQVAAGGFLIEKEVLILTNLLTQARPPFYAIIGGSKISSKIGILDALLSKVDSLFIGGGMAFTFLKAKGLNVGNSLIDEKHIEMAKQIIKRCKNRSIPLYLPVDVVIAETLSETAPTLEASVEEGIPNGWIGADIGPKTIEIWKTALQAASTIFWNGPLGVFELKPFANGTREIARTLADSDAMTIVGGGDSAAAVISMGFAQKITRLSTGGGATLEFIEFGTLPALEALAKK
jgi:phosphoglycerate kinase